MVGKKDSGEADQLTLASGSSEHAYSYLVQLYTSWGNKMNFSLYANMAGSVLRSRDAVTYVGTRI